MDEILGKKFNKLTVLSYKGTNKHRAKLYECLCDCGNTKIIRSHSIRYGFTKSCGCLQKQSAVKYTRLAQGESGFNSIFSVYRRNAKVRNYVFDESKEFLLEFKKLTKENCNYCGNPPYQKVSSNCKSYTKEGKIHSTYIYNGLDRIDNNKGYEFGNVVACCGICNRAKDIMSLDEFKDWINKVHKRFNCE